MLIKIVNNQSTISIGEEIEDIIYKCAKTTLNREGIDVKCECHITLVDSITIRHLNADFRGVDRVTDVLSFPLLDTDGDIEDILKNAMKYDKNPETGCVLLGDIIISPEKAQDQAGEYGHSLQRELGFLTVHGILHLLGYDHEKTTEREQMRGKEEGVLGSIGLTR